MLSHTWYLKQQVSLTEGDAVDGGHQGGEGAGRGHRALGAPSEHQSPLAGPAGAGLAFLHGGWREEKQRECF